MATLPWCQFPIPISWSPLTSPMSCERYFHIRLDFWTSLSLFETNIFTTKYEAFCMIRCKLESVKFETWKMLSNGNFCSGYWQAYFLSKIHPHPLPWNTGNWEFLAFWYEFICFLLAIFCFLSCIFHIFSEISSCKYANHNFSSPERHICALILAWSCWFLEILLWVF